MILQEVTKPTVKIFCRKGEKLDSLIQQVIYGMEEEQIPWDIVEKEEQDAKVLAYDACNQSVLGVGIGITNKELVLQHEKLPLANPLYIISASSDQKNIRNLGVNGARLVKKMPLKPIEHRGGEK